MSGVLGLYMFDKRWRIAPFGCYGLLALQHRGQETAGLITLGEDFHSCFGKGWVEDVLSPTKLEELEGHLCVGHVSPYEGEMQPLFLDGPKKVALALDGKITGVEGHRWDPSLSPERNILNALSSELASGDSLKGLKSFFSKCRGGFSFVALTQEQTMLAGRDPRGVKPLVLAKIGFDGGIVASETCASDTVGERMPVSPAENIEPGELRIFTPFTAYSERMEGRAERYHCGFEYVYLARPDSYINNTSIYKVRREIGRALADESPVEADLVIGVPETAIPFAMAYSNETGIPIEKGFEQTGRRVRAAIRPTQFERLKGVQLKLNVISEAIRGKRVVLLDDSVVRGNTLANIVYLMKEKGAKEIHVRIGSPHIIAPCPYGTEVPPADELIGKHLSEERIAQVVGADSFHYLSFEGLVNAIGTPKSELCLGCFTGEYREQV